jgi:hypothetical protein
MLYSLPAASAMTVTSKKKSPFSSTLDSISSARMLWLSVGKKCRPVLLVTRLTGETLTF